MKSSFSISLGTILAVVVLGLFAVPANVRAQGEPTSQNMKGKTAGEFYKNVKVLKDIPAADIHPAMEYITASLGVGCGYCHDVRHFDNDDKATKKTARNMMEMMFALDGTAFNGRREVTCYTCHRGAAIGAAAMPIRGEKASNEPPSPDSYPAIVVTNLTLSSSMSPVRAEPGSEHPAGRPAAAKVPPVALPSADEVLNKYVQALGGEEAIQKAATLVEKGTVQMRMPNPPGVQGPPAYGNPPAEVYRKAPDKAVVLVHLPAPVGTTGEGYDGSIAWFQGGVLREETGGEAAVVRDWARFIPAAHFKEGHSNIRVSGIEQVGPADAYVVTGVSADGSSVDRLYFDTKTGLLLRSVTNMESVLGSYPVENYFEDYRQISGLQVPFTVRAVGPEGERIYKWDNVEINTPVEETRFAMPTPKPEARSGR